MSKRKFQDGEILGDIITGYTGVVVGYTEYFTGCRHYGLLNRHLTKEGKTRDWVWFDESRLVSTGKKITITIGKASEGGPAPTPPQCN